MPSLFRRRIGLLCAWLVLALAGIGAAPRAASAAPMRLSIQPLGGAGAEARYRIAILADGEPVDLRVPAARPKRTSSCAARSCGASDATSRSVSLPLATRRR